MALTLSIVSFSCTGPILGSLLAGSLSADGGAWQLTAGMCGFGVALGGLGVDVRGGTDHEADGGADGESHVTTRDVRVW